MARDLAGCPACKLVDNKYLCSADGMNRECTDCGACPIREVFDNISKAFDLVGYGDGPMAQAYLNKAMGLLLDE